MTGGGFCTHCGHRVDSFEGLSACPACGSKGVPCANEDQVTVSINWHELRLLCIWAENWQRSLKERSTVVYAIARRIAAQHPGRSPLTLAGEIADVAKQFGGSVSDPKLRRDVAEQHGIELEPPPRRQEPPQP